MRWPLRIQIFLPFTLLMLGMLAAVSLLGAYGSARWQRQRVQEQLRNVARTLAESNFPLTDAVLRQGRGLSGADLTLATLAGKVEATTDAKLAPLPADVSEQSAGELVLDQQVRFGEEQFFATAVKLPPRYAGDKTRKLYIFYPEKSWRQAWRETVYPPLATGAIALVLAGIVSAMIAARVSRPISRLRTHVSQIAEGEFQPLTEPRRDDEIRDLARAVNRMAQMLASYEDEVRRSERLRALGQLRGGLAHQLRNAVTGCRMALDLYRRRLEEGRGDESLDVAHRQLVLIEKHLEQFLRFDANSNGPPVHQAVDLQTTVETVLPLVAPAAQHVGVALQFRAPQAAVVVQGDAEVLSQMLVNLLLNAVEAAAHRPAACDTISDESTGRSETYPTNGRAPQVVLSVVACDGGLAEIRVADTGPGPSSSIQDQIFEPLITGKPSGTGLGLSVSRDIAREHGGSIRWERQDDWTHFVVELPLAILARSASEGAAAHGGAPAAGVQEVLR
jgi:signal transduction histidine kinase